MITVLIVTLLPAVCAVSMYGIYIALGRLYRASTLLTTQTELIRNERLLLLKQKELALVEISLQSMKMEKAAVLVQNSISSAKMVSERMADPEWAKDFESGRDNAQWN